MKAYMVYDAHGDGSADVVYAESVSEAKGYALCDYYEESDEDD